MLRMSVIHASHLLAVLHGQILLVVDLEGQGLAGAYAIAAHDGGEAALPQEVDNLQLLQPPARQLTLLMSTPSCREDVCLLYLGGLPKALGANGNVGVLMAVEFLNNEHALDALEKNPFHSKESFSLSVSSPSKAQRASSCKTSRLMESTYRCQLSVTSLASERRSPGRVASEQSFSWAGACLDQGAADCLSH